VSHPESGASPPAGIDGRKIGNDRELFLEISGFLMELNGI